MNRPQNTTVDFSKVKKILIVRLGKIGDVVVTSFVFEIIKKRFPAIEIHFLTLSTNKDVIKYNPHLSKVFYANNNLSLFFTVFSLRKEKYDMIMDFNDNVSSTTASLFRFVRARIKAGYDFPKYAGLINYPILPLDKAKTHIVERMENFLIQLGLDVDEALVKPFFHVGRKESAEVKEALKYVHDRPLIMINLSAGEKIRCWSDEKWISLIRMIQTEYPQFAFHLLSTKEDFHHKEIIAGAARLEVPPQHQTSSLQHFAAFIKSAHVLITPDTSAVHIASAFAIPTVALFPNPDWNFVSWQPYRTAHRSLKSPTENIDGISADDVFRNFKSLVAEIGLDVRHGSST